jgi:hypothetical protein
MDCIRGNAVERRFLHNRGEPRHKIYPEGYGVTPGSGVPDHRYKWSQFFLFYVLIPDSDQALSLLWCG